MRTTREKLVDDFAEMLTEAEELMKRAANETGDRAKDLRTQVEAKLLAAKSRLQEMQGDAIDGAKAAVRVTDDYVHDNPWQAIGVSAAIGFLVGEHHDAQLNVRDQHHQRDEPGEAARVGHHFVAAEFVQPPSQAVR